jgi:hypothetical protein
MVVLVFRAAAIYSGVPGFFALFDLDQKRFDPFLQ